MKGEKSMNSQQIGTRLRHLRGQRTQSEVARACGITETALACYEDGQRIPRDEVKLALACYYDMSVESIFYAD